MEQRDRLVTELRAREFEVVDSDANFVLFGRFDDQAAAWQALLDEGVLVRDVGLAGWLRVTAGLPAEVTDFLAAVDRRLR
jgi:histidinol-phosphate aminotransferase